MKNKITEILVKLYLVFSHFWTFSVFGFYSNCKLLKIHIKNM